MLIKELLLAKPIVCLIDDYLQKPAQLMAENDIECVPVVESLAHLNLIGVVSEKEICRQAIAAGLDPSKTTVGRIMSCRFLTVDPETEVEECLQKLKDNRMDYLFVTDENNSCLGILTEEDLPESDFRLRNQNHDFHYIRNDRIF
jgi:predicted transcriptional regulator